MKIDFLSTAMSFFQYLTTEYNFAMKKSEISERSPETEGRIEFETATTFVIISSEHLAISACVGRAQDDRYKFFLNPVVIYEYTALSDANKKLVYSLNPQDDKAVRKLIRQVRSALPTSNIPSTSLEYTSAQLSDYSKWLRKYADSFLRGNFSRWLEIYEYKVLSMRAAYIRSGKEEFVRTASSNKDERVSIFQGNLHYLDRLRSEYKKA